MVDILELTKKERSSRDYAILKIPWFSMQVPASGAEITTAGGRVMAFTSFGGSKEEALGKSYAALNEVCYEGINYRKDIGFDL